MMIFDKRLNQYSDIFSKLEMVPLSITAHLSQGSRIIDDGTPINLDNILAYAVVTLATKGSGLADSQEGYWIPLPLKMLWQNTEGFPLWDSTCFVPIDPYMRDTLYMHKRGISGTFSKFKGTRLNVSGRHMDRRKPNNILVCNELVAHCVGHKATIEKLLTQFVTHLGKRRNIGLAHVVQWKIEEAELPIGTSITVDGIATRNIPGEYLGLNQHGDGLVLRGWTPPQWKPSMFAMCIEHGHNTIPENIDYFECA